MSIISWKCKKQQTGSLSTRLAEHMAAVASEEESLHVLQLIKGGSDECYMPVKIFGGYPRCNCSVQKSSMFSEI